MKKLTGLIVLLDLAFVAGCLVMPRSGMEAMGSVFILIPLALLHLSIGAVAGIIELYKKRWKLPLYFVLSSCFMLTAWQMYSELKPTYRPLYKALRIKTRELGGQLLDYKDQKMLEARTARERWRNADHASLCKSLEYPVDIHALSQALANKPEQSLPCALIRGRESLPLVALLAESYEKWARDKEADKEVRLSDIRSAADLLLKAGGDPNIRDDKGNTPLHWALWYKDKQLVSQLLDSGACVYLNRPGFSGDSFRLSQAASSDSSSR